MCIHVICTILSCTSFWLCCYIFLYCCFFHPFKIHWSTGSFCTFNWLQITMTLRGRHIWRCQSQLRCQFFQLTWRWRPLRPVRSSKLGAWIISNQCRKKGEFVFWVRPAVCMLGLYTCRLWDGGVKCRSCASSQMGKGFAQWLKSSALKAWKLGLGGSLVHYQVVQSSLSVRQRCTSQSLFLSQFL